MAVVNPAAMTLDEAATAPVPGSLVWLAGDVPAVAARSPDRQPATAPRKAAVSSEAAQRDAAAIERIVLERAVERMLRERIAD